MGLSKSAKPMQRLRARWLLGALMVLILTAAAASVWVYPKWNPLVVGGGVLAFLTGMALAGPAAGAGRLFASTPSWREDAGGVSFAGVRLGFELLGSAVGETPDEVVGELGSHGGLFADGRFNLILWVIATDGQGGHWTLVQERHYQEDGRTLWTASLDGSVSIADLDGSGRPSTIQAVHRIAKADLDIPLVDITIAGWGREHLAHAYRDVAVGFAHTSVSVERLRGNVYPGSGPERHAHLVTLDPRGTAKILGWGVPSNWHGGAAYGLLEALESVAPGSWVEVERAVQLRWYDKVMFDRVNRGTEHLTSKVP